MFKILFKSIFGLKKPDIEIKQEQYNHICQFYGKYKAPDFDHIARCKVGNYFMEIQHLNFNAGYQYQEYKILDTDKKLLFKCCYNFDGIKIWDNIVSYEKAHTILKEVYQFIKF